MITVIMPDQSKKTFDNFNDLFAYIVNLENEKMLEEGTNFAEYQWSFVIYSPENVQRLFLNGKEQPPIVKQAWEQQLPLIEVCTGDFWKAEYHLITPGLSIRLLRQKWVLAYCVSHGMIISANA